MPALEERYLNTRAAELTIHAVECNFNPGMSDIATGTTDGDNGVFEVTGLGKEFMQYGSYTTTITWQK